MRKPLIVGNWKCFKTREETRDFINELKPLYRGTAREVAVCVPYTSIEVAKKYARGSKIHVGAQNIAWADEGAFTGEISAAMLKDVGAEFVIIGHSERRAMFGETDATVAKRLKQALKHGFRPIVCVGESLDEREKGYTQTLLSDQISAAFDGVSEEDATGVIVAYEPIWAIGTGRTATAEQAAAEIRFIRKKLSRIYSVKIASKIRILYGGSVNSSNFATLMATGDIDGGLVGGASLKVMEFAQIINYEKN